MTRTLSPPVSRALAVAIPIAIIAGLYYALVVPLRDDYLSTRQSIEQLQDELARYRRVADDLPAREAELAALKQRQPSQDGFLQGPNDTLIAAQIQNRIKALSDAAQGDLRSIQILPAQNEGKLHRITVRGQMATTMGGIQRVFYGLEATAPFLFLDNVAIRGRLPALRIRGAAPNTDILDVQFDVYGYTRTDR